MTEQPKRPRTIPSWPVVITTTSDTEAVSREYARIFADRESRLRRGTAGLAMLVTAGAVLAGWIAPAGWVALPILAVAIFASWLAVAQVAK